MTSDQRRNKETKRFESENPRDPYENYQLLRVVAIKAAERVNAVAGAGAVPVAPDEVTERAWDEARPYVEEYDDIPTARHMCTLLPDRDGKPFSWRPLMKLAFDERSIERVHQERQSIADDPYIGESHIYYALNRAAQHVKQKTVSGQQYVTTRSALIKADERRRNGGHLAALFPTLGQIEHFIKNRYERTESAEVEGSEDGQQLVDPQIWASALEIAELEPQPEQPNIVRRGVPYLEAAIRFYEVVGFLPSRTKLSDFARDFDFALEGVKTGVSWRTDVIPEVIAEIRRRGLPEPPPYDPRRQQLTWEVPEVSPWPDDPPHRAKTRYTHAMVLTEMAEFRDWLRRGEAPTVDRYVEYSAENEERPSIGTIVEHGGIDQLFEELAAPDALERAYREVNPTAEELAVRESEQLERRLLHPTPQGIIRVITERGEASARELGEALGIEKGSVNNWLPHLERAGKIETTTPSRVAKNVKYCLKGQAPTPDEVKQRKLEKAVAGERCQLVLKLIRENDGITMAEMSEVLGSRPEVVAKWVRPLKALEYVQQVDDRSGGKKRTWYRALSGGEADSH